MRWSLDHKARTKESAISPLSRSKRARTVITAIVLGGAAAVAIGAAPTLAWVHASTSSGPSAPSPAAISVAPDGTSVAAGAFLGSGLDLGDGIARTSGSSGTRQSVYVQRLSASGAVMWARSSTGTGTGGARTTGVAAQPDGSSVIAGYIEGSSVDLGDGVARSAGIRDGFTQRLAPDGAVRWVSTTSGGPLTHTGASPVADGGTLVSGGFSGTGVDLGGGVLRTSADGGTRNSAVVTKFAGDGSVVWARVSDSTGASDAQSTSVSAFPDGTSVATGTFQGAAVDLGDGVIRTSANAGSAGTLFVEKLTANGSIAWVYTSAAAGTSFITGQGVGALPDGTSAVTGYFRGAGVDLGDGIARTSANAGADNSLFTVRLRADGTVMWVRVSGATGTSHAEGVNLTGRSDGSVVTTGWFSGASVDLGDGVSRASALGGTGASSFLQAVASDGSTQWTTTSFSTDTAALADGSLLTTGAYTGTAVDLGDGVVRTSPNSGTTPAAFVAKLGDRPSAQNAAAPTADAGSALRLTARTRCARGRCITTGTAPAGTTYVRQVATRRTGSSARLRARAHARATGRCTTTGRTYRCRLTLAAGSWSIATTAGTAKTTLARATTHVRVRTHRLPAVTG